MYKRNQNGRLDICHLISPVCNATPENVLAEPSIFTGFPKNTSSSNGLIATWKVGRLYSSTRILVCPLSDVIEKEPLKTD